MVSFYSIVAAAVVAVASIADAHKVGVYFRPAGYLVSGVPGNVNAPFCRTPCPALNALANHGFLPRNGKNITNSQLRDVVMTKFNLELALADRLVSVLPATFDLNLLGTHDLIEHDASLVHADSYFGADPSKIDATLLRDVLTRANATQPFSVATFGQLRKERLAACKANNPSCTFGAKETQLAFGESALILLGFGDAATETASLARVISFLKFECFPAGFQPSALITTAGLTATSVKIITAASS